MTVTIKDIASHCGVSVATVSRAMNNTSFVDPEKKEMILSYAREQGWQASNIATSLKSGKTKTVAIMANTLNGINNKIIVEEVALQLQDQGLHTFIGLYGITAESQLELLSSYQSRQLDALAVIAPRLQALEEELKTFVKKKTRVILVNENKIDGCALVTFDFKAQGEMAMAHMIDAGHREVLFIGQLGHHQEVKSLDDFSSPWIPPFKQVTGASEVAQQTGIDFNMTDHVFSDNYDDFSYIEEAMLSTKASAIICSTPYITARVYELIEKHDKALRGKFSVLSIGWDPLMLGFSPTPDYLDIGREELGKAISTLILDKHYDAANDVFIQPRLITGGRNE